MDTDLQTPGQAEALSEAQVVPPGESLADGLDDPLAGESDPVQMAVPPKPGAGPKVSDRFDPLDAVAAQS